MQSQRVMMKTISYRDINPDQMMQGVSFQVNATPVRLEGPDRSTNQMLGVTAGIVEGGVVVVVDEVQPALSGGCGEAG
jgi:hypothetical protein